MPVFPASKCRRWVPILRQAYGLLEVSLMQAEEGLFLCVVKSMPSFHVTEAQWDAGVFQSPVSLQPGMIRPGPLPQLRFVKGLP